MNEVLECVDGRDHVRCGHVRSCACLWNVQLTTQMAVVTTAVCFLPLLALCAWYASASEPLNFLVFGDWYTTFLLIF